MLAYVDTSVLIPYVENSGVLKKIIETELSNLYQRGIRFCISQAVILETLYKPYRENNSELIAIYLEMFESIELIKNYSMMLSDSIIVMQQENLKAMDAIHVALAKHHGCELFVTTDSDFQNLNSIKPVWIDLSNV